ncbi:MAG: ATP-dependent Clp protease ATP-binding subunit [Clostridia bacterium]|nr:ATP-dependent Clp protease ATP-binding subunit [Clostridia bacterium]
MQMCQICGQRPAIVKAKDEQSGEEKLYCFACAASHNIPITPQNCIVPPTFAMPADASSFTAAMQDMLKSMGIDGAAIEIQGDLNNVDLNELVEKLQGSLGENLPEMFGDEIDDEDDEEMLPPAEGDAPKKRPRGFIFGIDPSKIGITPDMQSPFGGERRSVLEKYAVNLSQQAKEGLIEPVIGRDEEIKRTIEILNRRTKNNPVLIGSPGVGKTAIVEGVALKIASRDVPEKLFNVQLYQLDLTSLISGTQFRGQFEARIEKLVKECAANPDIVLVMDEIHSLASLGASEGSPGAGNILKPALSRGEIQIIGTTTADEYRQHIEKDAALERRFQPVVVDEPTRAQTIDILKGITNLYSDFHNITIDDDAITAAVDLSEKYISDRFQPDNAIDVLDEAAASLNAKDPNLNEIRSLYDEDEEIYEKLTALEDENGNVKGEECYEEHAHIVSRRCQIEQELNCYRAQQKQMRLTSEHIAEVISRRTGIPATSIHESDRTKLLNLEARLHERLIGQDAAVTGVAQAIRRRRAFKMSAKRPVSFIFVGPTGVGKTELVKALAEKLFDDEKMFIRLDMSEYMEKEAVSKLIGAPPGYIGYEEGGQLTEKVRLKPYSVILLDEIEKAHADVFNILLQILDDGRLTDSHGKVVNFENTIIIMTSNTGTRSSSMGFGGAEGGKISTNVDAALKETFRPEFLNRVDEIVEFKSLTTDELKQIADLMLKDITSEVTALGATLNITENAKNAIVTEGYIYKYGARPMRRTIQNFIENPIAEMAIAGDIRVGSTITVDTDENGKIKCEIR